MWSIFDFWLLNLDVVRGVNEVLSEKTESEEVEHCALSLPKKFPGRMFDIDCSILEYEKFGPIKLSLLDVDLYLPTLKTLQKLYRNTLDGGVIIVDDVKDNMTYDGAFQAYMEFCKEIGKKPNIVGNRCGLIYKNK